MSKIYCNCIKCGKHFWSDSFGEFSCPHCNTKYLRYYDAKLDTYIIDIKKESNGRR